MRSRSPPASTWRCFSPRCWCNEMYEPRMAPRPYRKPLRSGERGQALVEFAIIVTLMIALISGIVDFGRAFNGWIALSSAAREGARLAAVGASEAEITDWARGFS